MSSISKHDKLKIIEEVFTPDPRIYNWCELTHTDLPHFFHEELKKIALESHVPKSIFVQFEIARNIFLYSFYSYRMAMGAQLYSFSVLEMSLKIWKDHSKFKHLGVRSGLKRLFLFALENGGIDDSALEAEFNWIKTSESDNHELCLRFINYYSNKRNMLAHGSDVLDFPWETLEVLRGVSLLINYLFSKNEEYR